MIDDPKLTKEDGEVIADIVEAFSAWLPRQISKTTNTHDKHTELVAAYAAVAISMALPPQEDEGKALGLMCRGAARVLMHKRKST